MLLCVSSLCLIAILNPVHTGLVSFNHGSGIRDTKRWEPLPKSKLRNNHKSTSVLLHYCRPFLQCFSTPSNSANAIRVCESNHRRRIEFGFQIPSSINVDSDFNDLNPVDDRDFDI